MNTPAETEAFPTRTRDVSHRWVESRLALVRPHEDPSERAGHAEVLVMIAEQYELPIELLIEWIDTRAPGKLWAATEWRRWCQQFQHARLLATRLPPKEDL